MDSLLQEREHRNFMVSGHDQYRTNVSNDSFPRSLSHTPLVVDSPLPSGAFALWPPTPLLGASLPESPYPTSPPGAPKPDYLTYSPWETSLSPETHPVAPDMGAAQSSPLDEIPGELTMMDFDGNDDTIPWA